MAFKDTEIFKINERIIALKGQENRLFKVILNNKEVKDLIINLNTEHQLMTGNVDSENNPLFNQFTNRDYYAASDPLGRGGKKYQVFNSGDYYDSFRVEIGDGTITITSNPNKEGGSLFDMYTPKLEGLNDSSLEVLRAFTKELYVRYFRDQIIR